MGGERLPELLYVAGNGRSGSTLLTKILGEVPEVFGAGELRQAWKTPLDEQLCSCGDLIRNCSFWGTVLDTFESLSGCRPPEDMRSLQTSAERKSLIPSYIAARFFGQPDGKPGAYGHAMEKLYRVVHKQAGAKVIVDSSKRVRLAFLLNAVMRKKLTVVHLVRDPRAVANSWLRKKEAPRPENEQGFMPNCRPTRVARRWLRRNSLLELLKTISSRSVTVRYETLARYPRRSIARVLKTARHTFPSRDPILEQKTVQLKSGHVFDGNPMRFESGSIKIQLDDRWRKNLDSTVRRRVSAITSPLLFRYNYKIS